METNFLAPSFVNRLAAIFYDVMLLFSLLFALTLFLILPFNQGNAVGSGNLLYQAILFLLTYIYFVWHWTHGGQTLGMRAWKIRLVSMDNAPVNKGQASLRFLLAMISILCLGLGFAWAIFTPDRQTWHDRFSRTCLVKCNTNNS